MPEPFITKFAPNRMQRAFIMSQARADLFSSRMGEGKSTALCWSAFFHTRHNPGAEWALVRDTWENMQATTMKSFFEWFPPGIYGTFNQSKKRFEWAEGVAKGAVTFMGMDDPQDASRLMSRELAGLCFDEPAPAIGSAGIDEMIFDIGLTRLRQPGMQWYGCKLAENNPDENHWTYRRFALPGHDPDFILWQPPNPENMSNLPANYYENLRRTLGHRPDLVRRFVDGDFGFQSVGRAVTPQWIDKLHLAVGLVPVPRTELVLLWDFGLNPTCIVTQKTPLGSWLILDAMVGDGIGAEELIEGAVAPLLRERYPRFGITHVGDPAGTSREQSSSKRSAVRSLKTKLGGVWHSGPQKTAERLDPLRAVLTRTLGGRGLVQVDRDRATAVWQALRGGWHYHVARTGLVSGEPEKDMNSHPGDAMGYGAAYLFPMGRRRVLGSQAMAELPQSGASYFNQPSTFLGRPGIIVPQHGDMLKRIG
jgi:hypothetical protein